MTLDQSWPLLIVGGCIAIAVGTIAGVFIGHKKLLLVVSGVEHRIFTSAANAEKHTAEKPARRGRRRGRRGRNRRKRRS